MSDGPLRLMLVAGEASGDDRGAALMRALKARTGEGAIRFSGLGGEKMSAEGVASPFPMSDVTVLGLFEGLFAYRRIVDRADILAELARSERPDVAVLIDSWGFTLRVAQRLQDLEPRPLLIKYVGPQVWASRPGRAKTLAAAVDHLLSIHSFDAPFFEAQGLPVTFVGNSALRIDFSGADPVRLRGAIGAGPDDPILLVLPGSRPGEIRHVLPPFADAVARLKSERSDLQVVIPAAPTVAESVKAAVAGWPFRAHVVEGEAAKHDAMRAATVALACSGTVTTELAMAGCPMVVGYRLGNLTHAVLKLLIRTPYITLFNIAAGGFVAPELVQDDCNGEALAREVARRLDDPDLRARQIEAQNAALEKMGRGGPDPSDLAAETILRLATARRTARSLGA